MIGIAHVLGIELPVGANELTAIAEHANRTGEDFIKCRPHPRPQIVLQRFDGRVERGEDESLVCRDPEFSQGVLGGLEIIGVARFSANAFAERHADEIAREVIAPLVIDTDLGGAIAAWLAADE